MDASVRDAVSEGLSRVFAEIEEKRGVLIGSAVRSFFTDLAMESLEVRGSEWVQRNLNPELSNMSTKIVTEIQNAVRSTVQEAATYKSVAGNSSHLLLVGVVEQAHKKWCGIFPFCR